MKRRSSLSCLCNYCHVCLYILLTSYFLFSNCHAVLFPIAAKTDYYKPSRAYSETRLLSYSSVRQKSEWVLWAKIKVLSELYFFLGARGENLFSLPFAAARSHLHSLAQGPSSIAKGHHFILCSPCHTSLPVTLLPPSFPCKNLSDYIGRTQTTQDSPSISNPLL